MPLSRKEYLYRLHVGGGLIASSCFGMIVFFKEFDPSLFYWRSVLCITIWGFSCWIGSRWRLIYSLLRSSSDRSFAYDPSWRGTLCIGVIAFTAVSYPLFGHIGFVKVLDALTMAIGVLYIMCKLGCQVRGCCRGRLPGLDVYAYRAFINYKLPAIEGLFTLTQLIFALPLIYFDLVPDGFVFAIFLGSHLLMRQTSLLVQSDRRQGESQLAESRLAPQILYAEQAHGEQRLTRSEFE